MNKKLNDIFNISDEDPIFKDDEDIDQVELPEDIKEIQNTMTDNFKELDKIDSALTPVGEFDVESDKELDDLAKESMVGYKDLMDLGMQSDSRFASGFFEAATKLMGHAIMAKSTKIRKKLDIVSLQLRKAKLDQDRNRGSGNTENESLPGNATVMDRNQLLAMIKEENNKK